MCWHSGVKERNQSCSKNSCNEPTLCKGRQKKSWFSYATLDTLEQLKKSHLISRTTMQTVHSSRQRESAHTMSKARKCDGVSQNLWIGFRSFWRQLKLLYQALGTPPSVTRKHSSRKIWHCHFTTFKKMSSFISTIMTWMVWKSATRIPKAVLCSSSCCLMSWPPVTHSKPRSVWSLAKNQVCLLSAQAAMWNLVSNFCVTFCWFKAQSGKMPLSQSDCNIKGITCRPRSLPWS